MSQGFTSTLLSNGPWTAGTGTNSALGGDGTSTSAGANSIVYGTSCTNTGTFNFIVGSNCFSLAGSNNLLLGTYAYSNGGSNNLVIGYNCGASYGVNNAFVFGNNCSATSSYNVAIGNNAIATYAGSVVWGDSNASPPTDTAQDQFCLTFANGYYFNGGVIHSPKIDAINDPINNLPALTISGIASAVNNVQVSNSTAGNHPGIEAIGADTNITLEVLGKGTGGVAVQGVADGSNAASGFVGEVIQSNVLSGSPTSFTSGVIANLTSIPLTAGDWDIFGNIFFSSSGTITTGYVGINTTTATLPDTSLYIAVVPLATSQGLGLAAPMQTMTLSGNQTVYLVGYVTGTGTITGCGNLIARRVR